MSLIGNVGRLVGEFTHSVADDAVRFYRGEGPRIASLAEMSDDMVGRYFTPELSSAMNYVSEAADRRLLYVDVPKSRMLQEGLDASYETVLPRDIADQAQEYIHKSQMISENLLKPNKPSSGRVGGVRSHSKATSMAHRRQF